ncbi:hypothetical protein D187_000541 [Cystobacter fuscus DSM 2262]|uniref:NACHT domain-containing protein n=1 Tax=Cystobacter fuscus (strain ATCC 25194 / DSM 2262 / NBRC 100088 / M29) TaxID=1242864 RepID=S9PQ34_CYSF2|nr:hypothetical protein D187_000541 [Cystobacter fuscus DSM 2262]
MTLLCLSVVCGQARNSIAASLSGSPIWPVPIATSPATLVPWGDEQHVWVVDEHGARVVDRQGNTTHEHGSWLADGFRVVAWIQTPIPGRAWVLTSAHPTGGPTEQARLYLVEAGQGSVTGRVILEAEKLMQLRQQLFQSPIDVYPNHLLPEPLEPHQQIWVVMDRSGSARICVIDAEGNVTRVIPLSALDSSGENPYVWWQVLPTGKEPSAWLKAGPRLFFLDTRTRSERWRPLLSGEGHKFWVVPGPDGLRSWVTAEVYPPGSNISRRQLYTLDPRATPGTPPNLLLRGASIQQLVASADGTRAWVAGSLRAAGEGGLHLIDINGKSLLPGGPLFKGQRLLIYRTPTDRLWALTESGGVFLLDANGRLLAAQEGLLSWLMQEEGGLSRLVTYPLGAEDLLVKATSEVVHVKHRAERVEAVPLLDGTQVSVRGVEPDGTGAWLQSERDGTLSFVSLEEPHDPAAHPVMKSTEVSIVIPSGERMGGWIQMGSASFVTVPREKMGATLKLRDGTLLVEPGGHVTLEGRLDLRAPLRKDDAGSVDLRWPVSFPADKIAGRLEVTLWDSTRADPLVASVTRQYAPGTPPPKLNWYMDEHSFGGRPIKVVFLYQDMAGTQAKLEVSDVLFHAPLIEQTWFRTTLACLLATLLFVLPLMLLPRQRLAQRWLPFLGWSANVLGGSGLFLAGMANTWRIHFPIFVGVLFLELLLGLVLGLVSPAAFRLLASTRPFWWMVPVALGLPSTRRNIQAEYVAHVGRKVEAWRHQANHEQYISLPALFREGMTPASPAGTPAPSSATYLTREPPEERIVRFLTQPAGGHVLIESPGGRGKSALLREVVRRMLSDFLEDPSKPLPVLCDGRGPTLEGLVFQALASNPLSKDIHEFLLLRGDYVLVVDGLTESALSTESLKAFLDGRYGHCVRLLLTSRPHLGFRQAVEGSSHWMIAEPRRLDDETLGRFVAAYAPEGHPQAEKRLEACRGADGTYLPILVRLALLFGHGSEEGIAALYEAAFRGLLRRQGVSGEEDTELLAWAGEFCLRTYWIQGIRSLRYRNAPEQGQMQKLLHAGLLVPEDASVTPGQPPGQVRFFHDSMQSYLTARGLFTRVHAELTWDILWRAAADPLFRTDPSELDSGADSELFQLCLQVFGPEEKLRRELRRQLLEWATLHDDDLSKRDILNTVPEHKRTHLEALLHTDAELSPRSVLRAAVSVCQEDLASLGTLYMRLAQRLWPWHHPEPEETWSMDSGQGARPRAH